MSCIARPRRHSASRWAPRLEGLESRRLFSASVDSPYAPSALVSVVSGISSVPVPQAMNNGVDPNDLSMLTPISTDPSDGAVLYQSPQTLNIKFNQPFDPTSLGQDIELDQINSDGTTTPIDPSLLSEPLNLTAPTDTLTVTLGTQLAPGKYQIVLLGSSFMWGASGMQPLSNNGVNETLATFTVATPGVTLNQATDLGTIGPNITVQPGALNFVANPQDVQLYKFTLAPGHFWRLGAEVESERLGGTLSSVLTLFDSQGNVITNLDDFRPDAPNDPYLFHGLAPGTYYLGVSGIGNVPGQPGGYNPVTGTPGTALQTQLGDSFQLHLDADTADSPTQLAGFSLNWADPLDTSPTGLTLTFAGPMSIDSFKQSFQFVPSSSHPGLLDFQFEGLQVVDQNGKTWAIDPTQYVESGNTFTFLFQDHLPAGHYRVIVPAQGGVTDLAGLTPTAPGQPNGVLATFNVYPNPLPQFPNNLGALLGNAVDGVSRSGVIPAGTGTFYRFVNPVNGSDYEIQTQETGGAVGMILFGPNGPVVYNPSSSGSIQTVLLPQLAKGTYYLELFTTGLQTTHFDVTIFRANSAGVSILDNGVGQGSALNLTLINPSVTSPQNAPVTIPTVGPQPSPTPSTGTDSSGATSTGSSTTGQQPGSPAQSVTTGGVGLVLSFGSTLAGIPSAQSQYVSVVGPAIQPGTTALAANTPGLIQGISYGQMLSSRSSTEYGETTDAAVVPDAADSTAGLVPTAPIDGALVMKPALRTPNHDEEALASAEWLEGIGAAVLEWVGVKSPAPVAEAAAAVATSDPTAKAEPIVLTRDDALPAEYDQVQHADIATPLGLGVISVMALKVREPLQRWLGRRRANLSARRSTIRPNGQGPHMNV